MELEDLDEHIKSLSLNDWSKLFDLIPRIKSMKIFSSGGAGLASRFGDRTIEKILKQLKKSVEMG